jgi:hypothetical protein
MIVSGTANATWAHGFQSSQLITILGDHHDHRMIPLLRGDTGVDVTTANTGAATLQTYDRYTVRSTRREYTLLAAADEMEAQTDWPHRTGHG